MIRMRLNASTCGPFPGASRRRGEATPSAVRHASTMSAKRRLRARPSLKLLLNCGQRDINFADHAARLELHSRRARELLREAFFDEKHPEASARRLSNERPSLFAPFEMKCAVTLIDLRRNIHASVGDCQRPVFARIRAQFIDRHNEGKRCSGINSYRRGLDSELLATRCFKRFNRRFQQFRQHRARPARPQKQVMDPTQCPQPRRDCLASVRQINGGAHTLVGYRLHDSQGVFHPVVQFFQYEPL